MDVETFVTDLIRQLGELEDAYMALVEERDNLLVENQALLVRNNKLEDAVMIYQDKFLERNK